MVEGSRYPRRENRGVAMIPAAVTIGAVDWVTVGGTAALAGVVSLLTSIAGLPEVDVEEDNNG